MLGVGVETVGTDAGQAGTFNPAFPNHTTMHGAGKFGITSLINLDQLPPAGAVVIARDLGMTAETLRPWVKPADLDQRAVSLKWLVGLIFILSSVPSIESSDHSTLDEEESN